MRLGAAMDKQAQTLHDTIRGHECHFEHVIYKAVESSLTKLGDQVYSLDWANLSVSTGKDAAKAA